MHMYAKYQRAKNPMEKIEILKILGLHLIYIFSKYFLNFRIIVHPIFSCLYVYAVANAYLFQRQW